LGRVVEKKGFDLLLRAFAQIAAGQPEVVLAIGGDGPALPALQSLADELEIADRVRFLGRLSRDAVAIAMEHAEIFVMPSRLEPFGIVVLEAWRAGRAVIATSRGGAPEFVDDGTTGLLVDPFDTPALAGALSRLLCDRNLARSLGEAARIRVKEFDWSTLADQYRDCYRAVEDAGAPARRRQGAAAKTVNPGNAKVGHAP
jgi:glycogen synthase